MSEGEQAVSAYTDALLEQTAESLDEPQRTTARTEQGRAAAAISWARARACRLSATALCFSQRCCLRQDRLS